MNTVIFMAYGRKICKVKQMKYIIKIHVNIYTACIFFCNPMDFSGEVKYNDFEEGNPSVNRSVNLSYI